MLVRLHKLTVRLYLRLLCVRTFVDMLSLLNVEDCEVEVAEVEESVESLWPVNNASSSRVNIRHAVSIAG